MGCIFFACGTSVGIQQLTLRSKLSPKMKGLALGASNLLGVWAANIFNLFSTRINDFF